MAGKHRRGARRDRLTDMSPPVAELDHRWSPDPEMVEDYPVELPLKGLGRIIGRQGLDRETGRLVEFAIMAQVQFDGGWREVARVDTCHEEVHFHLGSVSGKEICRKVLIPIHSPQDVNRGWDEGMEMLTDDWEENERRWRRGR
jgi:hypothetical protein